VFFLCGAKLRPTAGKLTLEGPWPGKQYHPNVEVNICQKLPENSFLSFKILYADWLKSVEK